jgi:thioredoxin reductase (NADPH)
MFRDDEFVTPKIAVTKTQQHNRHIQFSLIPVNVREVVPTYPVAFQFPLHFFSLDSLPPQRFTFNMRLLQIILPLLVVAKSVLPAFAFSTSSPHQHGILVGESSRHPRSTPSSSSSSSQIFMGMGEMEVIECDVAIVGGGPAGCTCALYTSRADLKTIILDKNPAVGALAITSHIANYPGVDKAMTGQELLDQMRIQAIEYGTEYRRSQVFMIDCEEGDGKRYSKTVYTPEATIKARSLVLATGAMGRVSPPFPGEEEYLGQGVSYCATCDGAFYRDSEVAVYGMNLEAMEEAMFLTKFASTVHWITPSEPRPEQDEHIAELLAMSNVKQWTKTRLLGVEGGMSGVTGVKVLQKAAGREDVEHVIPVEGAFIYAAGGGSKPITDFVQNKVAFKADGGVLVNEDMETSVKGVFAIGDIRNTAYKQVVVAAADGCIAAMSIDKYLKGRKSVKVDWIHQ